MKKKRGSTHPPAGGGGVAVRKPRKLRILIGGSHKIFLQKKDGSEPVAGEGKIARPSDAELVILGVNRLLALALNAHDPASKAAGKIVALVEALIAADCEKLCEANEVYKRERQWLGKSLRNDVWFPRSPLYQALHGELWHCWYYRGELQDPLLEPKWGSEEYEALMKLPPLSVETLKEWELELWKLLKKHNPDVLVELRQKADRKQVVAVHSDGVTRHVVKPRSLTWKQLRAQFHRHLERIATVCG
jgi:hypothetical protein